ncbi:outer membrane protein assembly factor BamA [Leucothrix arctica]|uniref:Outer membrane protein assembly factor BamA n=1 Tax=Leucothrix arctica TaxID=1481894 RepID=A0A317CIL2_9GAMM|nr:outer membrane protein assembly factor BamA [Leucothrix arctica]PWQ98107.1 outer membrane protein assembly factor BamA [Leucothrix arctica]
MKKQTLQLSFASCLFAISQGVWADSFVLQDIQVNGLSRISAGTVLSNVPVRVGQTFDDRMTGDIVKSLYGTGLFEDVALSRRGNILIVKVQERLAIGSLDIEGNKTIETKVLTDALRGGGIAPGRPLDKAALAQFEKELQKQYVARGNYTAKVSSKVTPLKDGRAGVKIDIQEGTTAKIRNVKITGNKAFPEAVLQKLLESGPKSKLAVWSSKDEYSKAKLRGDLDNLSSFYRDRGFLRFEVVSSQVSLSDDKRFVNVNINVKEGDQYRVGTVNVTGTKSLAIQKMVSVKQGQVFSQSKLRETQKNFSSEMGKYGYAFAKVNVVPRFDEINKKVDLTFDLKQGQRTYVRRINVRGNYRTKDVVFRREMRQLESSFYSKESVENSRRRIQRLSFVESVKIQTSPVAGTTDQVDLDVTVVEQSSNQFTAGVGYSQSAGVLFNLGLSQNNFMGTGKQLSVAGAKSESESSFNLSYNNPYYTESGIGRGFKVYYDETDATDDDTSDYLSDKYGASVNFSFPLGEDDSLRFSLGAEQRSIETTDSSPDEVTEFIDANGNDYTQLISTLSYVKDTRDRTVFPSEGQRHSIGIELGIPGSDLEYYKLKYTGSAYFPISENVTSVFKGGVSYGDGFGDDDLPFFENFYSGGIRTVRGFEQSSLGPDDSSGDAAGGNLSVNATAEIRFPVPMLSDVKGLKASVFVDAGNVFDDEFDADEVRYSAGVGLTWVSPLGPLSLSYAKPLNAEDDDDVQELQFSVGANF